MNSIIRSWILVFMFLLSCSTFKPVREYENTAVDSVIQMFKYEGEKRGVNIDIDSIDIYINNSDQGFIDGHPSLIGICYTYSHSYSRNYVVFKKSFIDNTHIADLETAILHELGHCLLLRDHKNTYKNYRPESLMITPLIHYYWWLKHRTEYLDELFGTYNDKGDM